MLADDDEFIRARPPWQYARTFRPFAFDRYIIHQLATSPETSTFSVRSLRRTASNRSPPEAMSKSGACHLPSTIGDAPADLHDGDPSRPLPYWCRPKNGSPMIVTPLDGATPSTAPHRPVSCRLACLGAEEWAAVRPVLIGRADRPLLFSSTAPAPFAITTLPARMRSHGLATVSVQTSDRSIALYPCWRTSQTRR